MRREKIRQRGCRYFPTCESMRERNRDGLIIYEVLAEKYKFSFLRVPGRSPGKVVYENTIDG